MHSCPSWDLRLFPTKASNQPPAINLRLLCPRRHHLEGEPSQPRLSSIEFLCLPPSPSAFSSMTIQRRYVACLSIPSLHLHHFHNHIGPYYIKAVAHEGFDIGVRKSGSTEADHKLPFICVFSLFQRHFAANRDSTTVKRARLFLTWSSTSCPSQFAALPLHYPF